MITLDDFRDRMMPRMIEYIDTNDKSAVEGAEYLRSGIWASVDSKTAYDDVRAKESMGPLERVEPGSDLPEKEMKDGFEKRLHKVKYAAIARYPMELLEFENHGVISDLTRGLAAARAHLMEIICAAVLEYGHRTLANVPKSKNVPIIDSIGADRNPLFYSAHPWKSDPSVTWKNRSDTLLDFSRGNLQAVSDDIDDWRLSNNAMTNITASGVVIPRNMRWKAHELFKSEKQPETGNNASNSLKEKFGSGDYFVYRWLQSQTDWYMRTTAPRKFKIRTTLAKRIQKGYDGENQTHWISNTTIFGCQVPFADDLYKVCAAD